MKTGYMERLKQGVLLFDSAMGTMLYEKGLFLNRCFEEACLSNPDIVLEIHRENISAGAQAITTNSFSANTFKLSGFGLEDKVKEINLKAAAIARDAAGDNIYVAGSVGPLGKRLAPVGKISREQAEEAFSTQVKALLDGGVDLILLETFKNLDELLFAVSVVRKLSMDIPLQAQYSFGRVNIEEYKKDAAYVAEQLDKDPGIDVCGTNCSIGPADMLEVLFTFRENTNKPISVIPNAGFPKEIDGRQMYLASPEYFSEYAIRFLDAGASVIGGCCGTTPKHIKKIAGAILSIDSGRKSPEKEILIKNIEEREPVSLKERSRLGRCIVSGEWITSIELIPPMGTDLSKIIDKAKKLKLPSVTCINLPDGPRASSRISAMITALEIERVTGIETILHVCCRDKNLIALQGDLLGAQAVGLRNMLFITGDPPKTGNYPDVTGVFDIDAVGLISLANKLNHGIDLGGNNLPSTTPFVMGAGVNPASTSLDTEIERAYEKAEAGAEYFITQPVFDADALVDFLGKIKKTGVPVIIGVWPLASYRNALFLNNEVPGVTIPDKIMRRMEKQDSKESARMEGVKITREIINLVRSEVSGIQVSPPFGNVQTALEVIHADF